MDALMEYCEALARPIKVAVIELEKPVIAQIQEALSVYNCIVETCYDPEAGCNCRQKSHKADLIFLADNIKGSKSSLDIAHQIAVCCPDASVVILTRTPQSRAVMDLMKFGAYNFLVKNGSFTQAHVRRIFSQLNLRLRDRGETAAVEKTESCQANV